jgi:RNA polymerase sigma-70 factor (ECF subfamily)
VALREVHDAYLTLSQEHREILLLVAIEGMQYEEAAGVLNVALGTVRSRLSRARQALRDALSEDHPQSAGATVSLVTETRHG